MLNKYFLIQDEGRGVAIVSSKDLKPSDQVVGLLESVLPLADICIGIRITHEQQTKAANAKLGIKRLP